MKFPIKRAVAICFSFAFSILAPGQEVQKEKRETKTPDATQMANSKLTYQIIDAPEKSFGYDIYSDERLCIHQPSVPGVAGNKGFKTKQDAEKIAQLVVSKMKKGVMPPTVSPEEMKKLKVSW